MRWIRGSLSTGSGKKQGGKLEGFGPSFLASTSFIYKLENSLWVRNSMEKMNWEVSSVDFGRRKYWEVIWGCWIRHQRWLGTERGPSMGKISNGEVSSGLRGQERSKKVKDEIL